MSFRITAAEVRARLRTIEEIELGDADLESLAFIESAEAEIDVILENNNSSYDLLTSAQKVLIKKAEILIVCLDVISEAPQEGFEGALVKFKGTEGNAKKIAIDSIEKGLKRIFANLKMRMSGTSGISGGAIGGDDYLPDSTETDAQISTWQTTLGNYL